MLYDETVTTTLHNNIVNVLATYDKLLASLEECKSKMSTVEIQKPQLVELYNKFIADVTNKWLFIEYTKPDVRPEAFDDISKKKLLDYKSTEIPHLCNYFFCNSVEYVEQDFFNGKPIILKGVLMYGFGKAANKYHGDPIIKFNSSCIVYPETINDLDGKYMLTSNRRPDMLPSISIMDGTELEEIKQFCKSNCTKLFE